MSCSGRTWKDFFRPRPSSLPFHRPQLKWTIGARSIRGEGLRCRKGVQPKKCCGNHAWIWRAAVYIHSTLNALPHSQTSNEQLSK